jgi:catechol 2,3-dioxygenase-like lactoylglutathione lyase family enzyme
VDVLSSRILLRPGDLDRSRRFYRDVLGLAVYREFGPPDDPGLVFFLGQGLLEVSGHAADPPGHSVMIWLQVRDVHAEYARLAAAGVPIAREPIAEPWGLIEMQLEDPDGIRIVLVEVPADHPLRRDPRPALPPGRRTACRITTRSTETRRSSARPVCGRRAHLPDGCVACLFELSPGHRHCTGDGCIHDPGLSPVFWTHYWSCPPCSYPERSGDYKSVTKTSDFYSQRQWHSAPMYSEYLRRFGVEDEIVACLPAPPGRSLRLLLRRDSGGFTERDKLLVELLRPHLHAVYQDAQQRQAGAPRLTARQWELLRLVAAGHLENIYQRLSVSSRTAAVALAFQSGYPT